MDNRFWKLVGISSAHLFAVQMVLPLLSPYFSSLGFSDAWISVVFGIFPLTVMLSANLVGDLSEQIGRSWTIKVALLAQVLAYSLYFLGLGPGIILARFVDAAAFIAVELLLLAKVEDILADDHRGRLTGVKLSVESGIRMFAPVVGGFLADLWTGWTFLLSIGILVSLFMALRDKRLHRKSDHVRIHPVRNLRSFIDDPDLLPMAVLGPFMHAMHPVFHVIIPLYITRTLGLSYTEVGLVAMAFALGSTLQFALGDLADTFGRRRFIILGTTLRILPILWIALTGPTLTGLIVIMLLQGIGAAMWNVTAWTYMSDVAERTGIEGRVIGSYVSIAKVGAVISYFTVSALITAFGYLDTLLVLSLLGFVGIAVAGALFIRGVAKVRTVP